MTGKEVQAEKKMIEAFRTRIKNLEKLFKITRIEDKESVMTRINVLKHKINAAEERIERPTVTVNRIFCKAGDGCFKR